MGTIIPVISPKGGVGKTTVTANLAAALGADHASIIAIDTDPQNALCLHLGLDPERSPGWTEAVIAGTGLDPRALLRQSPYHIAIIPFGYTTESEQRLVEERLAERPGLLSGLLNALKNLADFVLIDTPPGRTVFQQEALAADCSAVVVVLLADAASYAALPLIWRDLEHRPELPAWFLLNQYDSARKLDHDVARTMRSQLGFRLLPIPIHRDEFVREALAQQKPALLYSPGALISRDFRDLARWLRQSLGKPSPSKIFG